MTLNKKNVTNQRKKTPAYVIAWILCNMIFIIICVSHYSIQYARQKVLVKQENKHTLECIHHFIKREFDLALFLSDSYDLSSNLKKFLETPLIRHKLENRQVIIRDSKSHQIIYQDRQIDPKLQSILMNPLETPLNPAACCHGLGLLLQHYDTLPPADSRIIQLFIPKFTMENELIHCLNNNLYLQSLSIKIDTTCISELSTINKSAFCLYPLQKNTKTLRLPIRIQNQTVTLFITITTKTMNVPLLILLLLSISAILNLIASKFYFDERKKSRTLRSNIRKNLSHFLHYGKPLTFEDKESPEYLEYFQKLHLLLSKQKQEDNSIVKTLWNSPHTGQFTLNSEGIILQSNLSANKIFSKIETPNNTLPFSSSFTKSMMNTLSSQGYADKIPLKVNDKFYYIQLQKEESTNHYLGFIFDYTEERNREIFSLTTRQFLLKVLSNLNLGILIFNRKLNLTFCNAKAADLLGGQIAKLMGQQLETLDEYIRILEPYVIHSIRSGTRVQIENFKLGSQKANTYYCNLHVYPLTSDNDYTIVQLEDTTQAVVKARNITLENRNIFLLRLTNYLIEEIADPLSIGFQQLEVFRSKFDFSKKVSRKIAMEKYQLSDQEIEQINRIFKRENLTNYLENLTDSFKFIEGIVYQIQNFSTLINQDESESFTEYLADYFPDTINIYQNLNSKLFTLATIRYFYLLLPEFFTSLGNLIIPNPDDTEEAMKKDLSIEGNYAYNGANITIKITNMALDKDLRQYLIDTANENRKALYNHKILDLFFFYVIHFFKAEFSYEYNEKNNIFRFYFPL